MVAYRLGTGVVLGSNPGKGKNFEVKIIVLLNQPFGIGNNNNLVLHSFAQLRMPSGKFFLNLQAIAWDSRRPHKLVAQMIEKLASGANLLKELDPVATIKTWHGATLPPN